MNKDINEEEIINQITKLENTYKKTLKLKFKADELFSKNILKKELKKIRSKLRFLQKELDEKFGYEGSIYNHLSYTIIKTDYNYKLNAYDLYYQLKISNNPKKKLKLLRKIFVIYIDLYRSLDKEDYSSKKLINYLLGFIKDRIYFEKRKIKATSNDNNEKESVFEEPIEEIIKPKIFVDINNKDVLNNEDLEEVLYSYRNQIRNQKINSSLVDTLLVILKRLKNENGFDSNEELLCSILDSIRYRKLYFKKNNKEEKSILRECYKQIENFVHDENLRKLKIAEPYDYKFDIILELLKNENNYSIIKKLTKEYPQVVNIRNNKKSILYYLLQLYLNNYLMMINESESEYNIEYIKEVYKLFAESKSLYLSYEDTEELNNILDNFINIVNNSDIGSKTKNYIIGETEELYINYLKTENKYHKKVDELLLEANIKDIEIYDYNHSNRQIEQDLTYEHTFILNNPYTCYSFTEGKGTKSLKIHTADFSNLVDENSALDNYIYNSLLENNKIRRDIRDYLTFKEGDIVSAFTYEIIFDDDRNIKDFKIYRSRIKVDGDILDYTNNEYVYKNLRRLVNDYISEYGDNNLTGLNKIEYILKDILQKQFIKLARNLNLPLITYKEDEKKLIPLDEYSNIMKIFNNLQISEYRRLSKIFNDPFTEKYYKNKVRYNEQNELYLTGEINYIYLLNQRMIKMLINNEIGVDIEYYSRIKDRINEEYQNLVDTLNDILDYKFSEDFDYDKRKNSKKYTLKKDSEEVKE